jgi:hypothetical protein
MCLAVSWAAVLTSEPAWVTLRSQSNSEEKPGISEVMTDVSKAFCASVSTNRAISKDLTLAAGSESTISLQRS